MAHLGLIIVPLGYANPILFEAGTPYGATSISGAASNELPNEKDLEVARFQGQRVTETAAKLRS
ncbi:hypothetical protein BH11ARM2_BH11ARM2_14470 [soil metagenome]